MDPTLRDYITKARLSGTSDKAIQDALVGVGWDKDKVSEALQSLGTPKIDPSINPAVTSPATANRPIDNISTQLATPNSTATTQMDLPQVTTPATNAAEVAAAAKTLETIRANQQGLPPQKSTGPTGRPTNPARKSHLLTWIIAAVVLILVISGGVWFYVALYAPNQLLLSAASNFENAKSLQYQIDVTPVLGNKGSALAATYNASTQNTIVRLSGGYDLTSATSKTGTRVSLISTDNNNNTTDLLDGQIITIGKEIYGLVIADSQITSALNITNLTNQWWTGTSQSVTNSVNQATTNNEQNAASVIQAFKQHPPISLKKNLGSQTLGTESTDHFQLALNASNLQAFLAAAEPNSQFNSTSIEKFATSTTGIDVWIDPKTKEIVQLQITNNLAPYGSNITNYVESISTTINLTGIGQPLTINTPVGTQPFPGLSSLLKGL